MGGVGGDTSTLLRLGLPANSPRALRPIDTPKPRVTCHDFAMTCDGCVCTMQIVCSGHGHCLGTQSAYCVCNLGYSGAACGSCQRGYIAGGSLCVFAPGALALCTDGVRNGNEDGVDCGGSCGSKCIAVEVGGATGRRSDSVSRAACAFQWRLHDAGISVLCALDPGCGFTAASLRYCALAARAAQCQLDLCRKCQPVAASDLPS